MSTPTIGPVARPLPRSVVLKRWSEQVLGRDWRTAYLFAGPMVLLLVGLIGYPFVTAVWMSFFLSLIHI